MSNPKKIALVPSLFIFLTLTQIIFSQKREVQELDVNWKFQKTSQENAFEVNFLKSLTIS